METTKGSASEYRGCDNKICELQIFSQQETATAFLFKYHVKIYSKYNRVYLSYSPDVMKSSFYL